MADSVINLCDSDDGSLVSGRPSSTQVSSLSRKSPSSHQRGRKRSRNTTAKENFAGERTKEAHDNAAVLNPYESFDSNSSHRSIDILSSPRRLSDASDDDMTTANTGSIDSTCRNTVMNLNNAISVANDSPQHEQQNTGTSNNEWSCSQCTYLNNVLSTQCDMCNHPRNENEITAPSSNSSVARMPISTDLDNVYEPNNFNVFYDSDDMYAIPTASQSSSSSVARMPSSSNSPVSSDDSDDDGMQILSSTEYYNRQTCNPKESLSSMKVTGLDHYETTNEQWKTSTFQDSTPSRKRLKPSQQETKQSFMSSRRRMEMQYFHDANNRVLASYGNGLDSTLKSPSSTTSTGNRIIFRNSLEPSRYLTSTDLGVITPGSGQGRPTNSSRSRLPPSSTTTSARSGQTASQRGHQSTSSTNNTPNLNLDDNEIITPNLPIVNVNNIGGKLYPDLRHEFIKTLINKAKNSRRSIHQATLLESCIKAAIKLAIHPFPIRTAQAALHTKGIGSKLLGILKESEKKCKGRPYIPPRGKCSSVAAACLVALLEYEEHHEENALCPMETLIDQINALTHHTSSSGTEVLGKGMAYYLNTDNIDPGWMQVKKLCASNLTAGMEQMVKERRNKKLCTSGFVFELLGPGRQIARSLRIMLRENPASMGPLRQLASNVIDQQYGNVTMSIDFRECGGESQRSGLHKLCDLFDDSKVPYVVRCLKISDYVFFVGNKLAPLLVERKTVDDVAGSLAEDRWEDQQHNMRKAQYILGGSARKCKMYYIIEGNPNHRKVHGGKVGRQTWNQTVQDVNDAINGLPKLGFAVKRSQSQMGTASILSDLVRNVNIDARNGSISCQFTYEEFTNAFKHCSDSRGNPPNQREVINPYAATNQREVRNPYSGSQIQRPSTVCALESTFDNESIDKDDRKYQLKQLSVSQLKQLCKEREEKMSGTKAELIQRLLKPPKPQVLINRAKAKKYVPRVPSCNAALLVALLLYHKPNEQKGLKKEQIMTLANNLGISEDPMDGTGGKVNYDGWSGHKKLLNGDPSLMCVEAGRLYRLTTEPRGSAGVDVANALHKLAHDQNICRCGRRL